MSGAVERLKPLLTAKTFVTPSAIPAALIQQLARLRRPAQLEVVKMFVAATKRYDDAHRPDNGTTMDVMLDEVFPSFGSTALLALFSRFRQVGYFSHDRFDALFAPAFRNLDAKADAPKVVAFFTAYADEILEEDDLDEYQVAQLRTVFDDIAKHLPAQTRTELGARIEKAAGHPVWCKREARRFMTMPIAKLATMLARDGRELAFGHPLSDALRDALLARLSKLSPKAIEAFVANVVDAPETYSLAASVPYLFVKKLADAPAALVRLAGRGVAQRDGLVDAIECLVQWIGEDPDPDDPLRRRITKPRIVAAMKAALKDLKRFCARARATEASELPTKFAGLAATALESELRAGGLGYIVNHPATPAFQHAVLRHLAALPFDALVALAMQCIRSDAHQAMTPSVALLFLKDAVQADAFVNPPPPGNARGTLYTAMMDFERDDLTDGWDTRPWREAIHRSPATRKAIIASRKRLEKAFRSPLARV